jgi:hypothetical protein
VIVIHSLGITPDAVKVDLKAEETSENVKKLMRQYIKEVRIILLIV